MEMQKVNFVGHEENKTFLICPDCGFEYLHLLSASVHRGNNKTTITAEGINVKQEENKTRGVTIKFGVRCENGHQGELTFQFHEGIIYVNYKSLRPPSPLEYKDIWRD